MRCPRLAQGGVTLVELLVAWTLGLLVLAMAAALYAPYVRWTVTQHALARMDEDARYALDLLAREVRMAGYLGCRAVGEPGPVGRPGALPGDGRAPEVLAAEAHLGPQPLPELPFAAQGVLRGFDAVPPAFFSRGARPQAPEGPALYVARGASASLTLLHDMDDARDPIVVDADEAGWSQDAGSAKDGDGVFDLVMSDCLQATLLRARLAGRGEGAEWRHTQAMGNRSDALAQGAVYAQEAQLMPLEWRLFYVARRPGSLQRSLYEAHYDGRQRQPAQEHILHVETLQLQYGLMQVDTESGLGRAEAPFTRISATWPARWVQTASEVPDWSRVVGLRIGLVLAVPAGPAQGAAPLRRSYERVVILRPATRYW